MIERLIVGALRTNCYFYSFNKKDCLIIDPGAEPLRIISALENLNLIPAGIVLTHGHFDHTLGCLNIKRHFEKRGINIKIAIHHADRTYLGRSGERNNRKHFIFLGEEAAQIFDELFEKLPEPDLLLKQGINVFKSGLVVMETPGHTPGSICLYAKKDGLLFSGDTLFFESIGRTDLPGGNHDLLLKSLKEKILKLPPTTNIYPGHGPPTNLERELKGNPFLRDIFLAFPPKQRSAKDSSKSKIQRKP